MELKLVASVFALLLVHGAVANPVAPTLDGTEEGSGWAHISEFIAPGLLFRGRKEKCKCRTLM